MSSSLFRSLNKFLAVGLFSLVGAANANAVSLSENTDYTLSGQYFSIILDSETGQDYVMSVQASSFTDGNDILSIGNETGNHFDNAVLNATLSFNLYRYDLTTHVTGAHLGTVNGNVAGSWSNIAHNAAHDVAAGKNGEVSGGLLFINFAGNAADFGGNFSFAATADDKFAVANIGTAGGLYDNVVSYLGSNFSIALGDTGAGFLDGLHTWYMSALNGVTINGKQFTMFGDIHGTYGGGSAVPEPATLSLFGLSALAGVARRRKLAAKN